jgi:hypothetical protein
LAGPQHRHCSAPCRLPQWARPPLRLFALTAARPLPAGRARPASLLSSRPAAASVAGQHGLTPAGFC